MTFHDYSYFILILKLMLEAWKCFRPLGILLLRLLVLQSY